MNRCHEQDINEENLKKNQEILSLILNLFCHENMKKTHIQDALVKL